MAQPTNQPGPGQNNDPGTGGHPAWDEVLSLVPEEARPAVSEKLRAWDTGVQQKIQTLHSEYEPYKPFIGEYAPEDIQSAIQIAQALEADPQAFYTRLAEAYNLNSGQGPANQNAGGQQQQLVPPGGNSDGGVDPDLQAFLEDRFGKFEQGLGTLAQALQQIQQEREETSQMQELEQVITGLQGKYGEFDLDYVLSKIAAGMDPEKAVEAFQELAGTKNSQQAQQDLPTFLSSGGGLPSNQIDPSKLNPQDTKNLVAEILQRASQTT